MRRRVLTAAAAIIMTLAAPLAVSAHSTEAGVISDTAPELSAELTREEQISNKIAELMNERRTGEGRTALAVRRELAESAAVRANELPLQASHDRPDGSAYLTAVNLSYNQIGENFAYACTPGMSEDAIAAYLMEGWMNSQVHRDNILKNDWTDIGIGVCIQGDTVYAVQLFMEATSN